MTKFVSVCENVLTMKLLKLIPLVFVLSLVNFYSFAQRGKEMTVAIAGNQVVNTYTWATASAAAGSNSISVNNAAMTGGAFGATPLAQGDLVMIIQMYGADVDIFTWYVDNGWGTYTVPTSYNAWQVPGFWGTDPETFGQILAYNNAGKYEKVEVLSVAGNTINFTCGLTNSYDYADANGLLNGLQVIRIPRYQDLTVNAGASIIPSQWDGQTGGIVALEVNGVLDLQGTISSSGYGFRGGLLDASASLTGQAGVAFADRYLGTSNHQEGSERGESIYGWHAKTDFRYSRWGRGAVANSGAGGGYQNCGGGGGSNVEITALSYDGRGRPTPGYAAAWALDRLHEIIQPVAAGTPNSSGGGQGGYALSETNRDATTVGPDNTLWTGDTRKSNGGWGGHPLSYDATRMHFGGGGGAGDWDSQYGGVPQAGAGGNGGGIVYLISYGTIIGNGTIQSNGANGFKTNPANATPAALSAGKAGNDGAGGGGAGGFVKIENAAAIPATINISAIGGNGGNQDIRFGNFATKEAGGPGGAGSGGAIAYTVGAPTQSVLPGTAGTTISSDLSEFPNNGASNGNSGLSGLSAPFYDLIPTNASICAGQTANISVAVLGTLPGGATPASITWYSTQYGNTPIGNTGLTYVTPPLAVTTTYYVGLCPGTFRVPVTVTVGGGANLVITDPAPVCAPATVDLTLPAVTAGSNPGTLTYWMDLGMVTAIPDETAVGNGTYYIQLDAGGGCTAIEAVNVAVNPVPVISGTLSACVGATTQLSGTGTPDPIIPWSSSTPGVATVDNTGLVTGVFAGTTDITYMENAGCTTIETVTIFALPTISGTLNVCAGFTTALSGTGTSHAVTPWATSNPAVATVDNAGLVTGVSAGSSDITYMDVNGCTDVVTVTVDPLPTISGTLTACVGATTSLAGSGTPDAVTPWSSSNPAVATVDNAGLVTGVSAGSADITYLDANGCSDVETVTIYALPTIGGTFSVCVGATTALSGSGTPDAVTPWATSNPAVATVDNAGVVAGIAAGSADITYLDANGCLDVQTITVDPTPSISGTLSACVGATTSLSGTGTPDPVTPWSSSNPAVATVDNLGLVTGISAGSTDITYLDNNGCFDVETVTIYATPSIAGTLSVCVGLTTSLSGSGTPDALTPWSSSNPGVATVDNTGLVTGISGGSTDITYLDINGCFVIETVIVSPTPTINTTANDPSVCNGNDGSIDVNGDSPNTVTVNWSGTSIGTSGAGATLAYSITGLTAGNYNVTYTDDLTGCITALSVEALNNPGAPIIDPIADYTSCAVDYVVPNPLVAITGSNLTGTQAFYVASGGNPGDLIPQGTIITAAMSPFTIYAYDNNGACTAEISFVVTVNSNPTASITPDPVVLCEGSTVALNGNPAGGSGVYTSHAWTGNIGILTATNVVNPSTLAAAVAMIYNLTYTVTDDNGCMGSDALSITVNPLPTISGTLTACAGATTALSGSGTPHAVTPWSSSNPAIATVDNMGVVTGVAAGSADITYMDINGCTDVETVVIYATPTISGTFSVCEGFTTILSGTGSPDPVSPWTSSDPLIATVDNAGVVTGVAAGIADITYVDANGCSDLQSVTVFGTPTIGGTLSVCEGFTTQLTGSGAPDAVTPWSSSDILIATIDNTGLMTGVTGGNAIITYLDANGCWNTTSVTVYAAPIIGGTLSVCEGATTSLTGSGAPDAVTPWSSTAPGVATVDVNGLVTGVAAGTADITYLDVNGCSVTQTVTVNPVPTILTTPTDPSVCNGNDGQIEVDGNSPNTVTVDWSGTAVGTSGAGASLIYTITGLAAGNYDISYTDDATGCTTILSSEILNNPGAPVIDPISDTSSCEVDYSVPNPMTYITGSNLSGFQAFYSAPGGNIADIIIPGTLITAGMSPFTIYAYDNNGICSTEISFVVTVNTNPTANITPNPAELCEGFTLALNGGPAGGSGVYSSHLWTGNTGVLNATNVSNPTTLAVAAPMTYNLVYTVTDDNGCSGTDNVSVVIHPTPTIMGTLSACVGATTTLIGSGIPDAVTPWTSLDPAVATVDNAGVVTGVSAGSADIEYLDANGCLFTETITINANPTISGTLVICANETTQLTGTGTPDAVSPWTSIAPAFATVDNSGLVTGVSAGSADITYMDINGCTDTETITINAVPVANATSTTPAICEGSDILLEANTLATGVYSWTGPNGFVAAIEDPSIISATTAASGTYSLTITDNGCTSNVSTVDVSVIIQPVLDPISDVAACDSYSLPVITGTNLSGSQNYYDASQASSGVVVSSPITTTQTVYVYDGNATCNDEISFVITISPSDNAAFTLSPFCEGDPNNANITGTPGGTFTFVSAPSDGATIDAVTGEITNGTAGTTYNLEYSTSGVCPDVQTALVTILDCTVATDVIVPTAFTPDGDAVNNTWSIQDLDLNYPNSTVTVYNRWGNIVFQHLSSSSEPYSLYEWDGTYNGKPLPVASYFYVIDLNDGSGDKLNGTVSIILDK